jgi:D-alanyl-D-alanine carboxypeptidase
MLRTLSAILVMLLFAPAPQAVAQSYDQLLNSVSPRPPGTGFHVSVVRDGKVDFVGGRGGPAGARYMLASVTKQFTAAAVLALEKEGKLDLTDSVSKYLSNLPHWDDISVADLLSHRTTLPDYVAGALYRGGAPFNGGTTLNGLLSMIAGSAGSPRSTTCMRYSNSNYTALAAVIERASGESYGRYLQRKIFGPLGMASTDYSGDWLSGAMRGHDAGGAPLRSYHTSWANGAGGVVSTAGDIGKWNVALLDGFLDIVDRVRRDAHRGACQPGGNPQSYAYGWIPKDDDTLEHSGLVEGYSAFNGVDPDKGRAVAILSNFAGYAGDMPRFAQALADGAGGGDGPPANYCCTPAGRFGPGSNPDGLPGIACQWMTPFGLRFGVTCH